MDQCGSSILLKHQKLVGGIPTPLKHMKVSWDHYSQYMENKSHVPNPQPDSVPT